MPTHSLRSHVFNHNVIKWIFQGVKTYFKKNLCLNQVSGSLFLSCHSHILSSIFIFLCYKLYIKVQLLNIYIYMFYSCSYLSVSQVMGLLITYFLDLFQGKRKFQGILNAVEQIYRIVCEINILGKICPCSMFIIKK